MSDTDKIDAAVFRRLLEHLDEHKHVQNIDLMNLAGFCRNCLSKWYMAAAEEAGQSVITMQHVNGSTACPMGSGKKSTRPLQPRSSWQPLIRSPASRAVRKAESGCR